MTVSSGGSNVGKGKNNLRYKYITNAKQIKQPDHLRKIGLVPNQASIAKGSDLGTESGGSKSNISSYLHFQEINMK